MKMAGNRKLGFMRGSASGRNGNVPKTWHCFGCDKEHGARVNKTILKGNEYCDRQYLKIKEAQFAEVSRQRDIARANLFSQQLLFT